MSTLNLSAAATATQEEGLKVLMQLIGGKKNQAQMLMKLAEEAEVFRGQDGETAYATVKVGEHFETWPLRAKGFRRWLVGKFYEIERKPPGAQALQDALGVIEARAQFGGGVHPVCVRVAGHEGTIYLDLANDAWEAVEITPNGWRVVAHPPVKFRRARGMLPLPHPVHGGSLEELRPFINVRGEDQWVLFVAWLVQTVCPSGPYPVLGLYGNHGAAKSTVARVPRELIDPNSAPLRAEPRDKRDLMIAATNGWVISLDNVSKIPAWLSDALCRLATGGGFSTRELYTDQDEIIFEAQRPVILNGIEEIITRSDLFDRAIIEDLPEIGEEARIPEKRFWADFREARPRILGALLDAVSMALRRVEQIQMTRLPRMADFAVFVTAAAPALGWDDDHFLEVYASNRAEAHELALDASPVGPVVRVLAEKGDWRGTATELLETFGGLVDETTRRAKGWPTTGRGLAGALRRLAPNLRAVGVVVEFDREPKTGRRLVTVRKDTGKTVGTVGTVTHRENTGVSGDGRGDGPDANHPGVTVGVTVVGSAKHAKNWAGDDTDGRDDEFPARSSQEGPEWLEE